MTLVLAAHVWRTKFHFDDNAGLTPTPGLLLASGSTRKFVAELCRQCIGCESGTVQCVSRNKIIGHETR